jgi:hypothetical protein
MADRLRIVLVALAALAAGTLLRRRRTPPTPNASGTWAPDEA